MKQSDTHTGPTSGIGLNIAFLVKGWFLSDDFSLRKKIGYMI